jgi:hypothetical protein
VARLIEGNAKKMWPLLNREQKWSARISAVELLEYTGFLKCQDLNYKITENSTTTTLLNGNTSQTIRKRLKDML